MLAPLCFKITASMLWWYNEVQTKFSLLLEAVYTMNKHNKLVKFHQTLVVSTTKSLVGLAALFSPNNIERSREIVNYRRSTTKVISVLQIK